MPVTFEDILAETRRQEQENDQFIGQGPQQGLGAPFAGVGDLLRGIASMRMAQRRKDTFQKMQELAEKNQKTQEDIQGLTLQQKKLDVERLGNVVSEQKKKMETEEAESKVDDAISQGLNPVEVVPDSVRKLHMELTPDKKNIRRIGEKYQGDVKRLGSFGANLRPLLSKPTTPKWEKFYITEYDKASKERLEYIRMNQGKEKDPMKELKFGVDGINKFLTDAPQLHMLSKADPLYKVSLESRFNNVKDVYAPKLKSGFMKMGMKEEAGRVDAILKRIEDVQKSSQDENAKAGLFMTLINGLMSLGAKHAQNAEEVENKELTTHPDNVTTIRKTEAPPPVAASGTEKESTQRSFSRATKEQFPTPESYRDYLINKEKLPKAEAKKVFKEQWDLAGRE